MGWWSNSLGGAFNTGNETDEGDEDNESNEQNEGNEYNEGNEGNFAEDAASAISNLAGNLKGTVDRVAGYVGDQNGNEGNEGNPTSGTGTTSSSFANTRVSGQARIVVSEWSIIGPAKHITITFVSANGAVIEQLNGHSRDADGDIDRKGEPWDFTDTLRVYDTPDGDFDLEDPNFSSHTRVWTGTDSQLNAKLSSARGIAGEINDKKLSYMLLSQNSNSVATTILDGIGISTSQLRGIAPGAGNHLVEQDPYGEDSSFTALEYIASNNDLITEFGSDAQKGEDHYLKYGIDEARSTGFSGLEYIASYGDLIKAFGANTDKGADHYIDHGRSEKRSIKFDGLQYIASYGDLIKAYGADAEMGAMNYIKWEYGKRATDKFDAAQYLRNYKDLRDEFGSDEEKATIHYIEYGYEEGRTHKALGAPIIIDLDGDGIEIAVKETVNVKFDFDADGYLERTSWTGDGDGFLMFDVGDDNAITSPTEIAFALMTSDPYDSDLEALKSLFDENKDGRLDSLDGGWGQFRVWTDSDQNGKVDSGEIVDLDDAGISSIGMEVRTNSNRVVEGGSHINGSIDIQFVDGSTREGADVALSYDPMGERIVDNGSGGQSVEYEVEEASPPPSSGLVLESDQAFADYLMSIGMADNYIDISPYLSQKEQNVVFETGGDTLATIENTTLENLMDFLEENRLRMQLEFDHMDGTSADDRLIGDNDQDAITGGEEDDVLSGGGGEDQLTGGAGKDTFQFSVSYGEDVVTDFDANEDELDFTGLGLDDGTQALRLASQQGLNVVFDFGEGDTLTLLSSSLEELTVANPFQL